MYTKIMVPVDLTHVTQLEKALATAADLSKHYSIPICYVSVGAAAPGSVAHNPAEFAAKLEAFAHEQAIARGLSAVSSMAYTSHDPTVDLDQTLIKAIEETGSDLFSNCPSDDVTLWLTSRWFGVAVTAVRRHPSCIPG